MSTGIATRDIGRAGIASIALLAGVLLLLPVSAAAGSCSAGNRVNHRDAECLYAWWKNRGLLKKSPYHVSNQCPELGRVVAKVDLVSASDRTIHLTDGIPRDGDTRHRIRNIYCCSDLSAACNRSDLFSDAACVRQFERESSATRTCRNAAATYASENRSCTVSAECRGRVAPGGEFIYKDTSITVPIAALGDVHNCDGWLHDEACDVRPLGLSASDARAEEAAGATLDFTVTLSRPYWREVTVLYSTSDGTARAGRDYREQAGYLTFAPGETEKTVSVSVIDDNLDEGAERMWLSLNFQSPAWVRLADPAGMGTIVNADALPKAWIARFGRTVAEQVLDAVDARMRVTPVPGARISLVGQRIGLEAPLEANSGADAEAQDDRPREREAGRPKDGGDLARPRWPGHGQPATGHDLLPSSSLSVTSEIDGKGFVSVWGRGAVTRFSGREGELPVDGDVATGQFGVDWTHGRWMTGLIVSRSQGDGSYRGAGGTATSTLTGVWPWMRHALSARLSVWGVAGYGEGGLMLKPRNANGVPAGAIRTGLDLWMAAAGLRGVALDGSDDGFTLTVKTDAMIVRTGSDAVTGAGGNLASARAEVTRLRFGLEGSRPLQLADGSVLTPRMEIGLRRDSGDAEAGFGAEIGGGLAWTDPKRGLAAELRGHALLTHEAKSFRWRGFSGALFWDPVTGDRGLRLRLTRTLGRGAPDGADPLFERTTHAGLTAQDSDDGPGKRRLEARVGYGFPALGNGFTAMPEIAVGLSGAGRDYSLGCRLARGGGTSHGSGLEFVAEVRRSETDADLNAPPEHTIGFRVASRF